MKVNFAKRSEIFHKNIFDVKICAKYIFSKVILCKNGFKASKCRQVHSFITFVITYSGNYGNRKKMYHYLKIKPKYTEKYLARLLLNELCYEILLSNLK